VLFQLGTDAICIVFYSAVDRLEVFFVDRYMLPVQAPPPDYQSILTSADVTHSMSIVKLDPSRPSVVSVMRRSASSGGSAEDNPIAANAALVKDAISSPSGANMLMVSSTMRATRRASLMAATTMFESSAPAAVSPLQPPVKESPLIVPVTDTLDKSEIHLLSDILSRGTVLLSLHQRCLGVTHCCCQIR
jgi:hypothetical protein